MRADQTPGPPKTCKVGGKCVFVAQARAFWKPQSCYSTLVKVQMFSPVRSSKKVRSFDLHGIKTKTSPKKENHRQYCSAQLKKKKIQQEESLWFNDRNTSAPSTFITSPYLSQVTLDLCLFATRQATTTFTESPDRLNLETSALGTASSAVIVDVPGCRVK